ncbi:MAG: DUF2130 domain-containing protein, partial [Bacteroidetes bacterium]|nr:DUF2130 domain-containing protein [Bacteroidota bacterium]
MNEIICPNCKKTFKVDEAGFADILKQVRDHQFEEEIRSRLALAEREKAIAIKLAEETIKNSLQEKLSRKDQEWTDLKAKMEVEWHQKLSLRESELLQLKAKMDNAEVVKELAVSEATKKIEKERDELSHAIQMKETEKELLQRSLTEQFTSELKEKDAIIKHKDEEIALRKEMKAKLSTKMIGETLEQHCETAFNQLRATAFQKAYFEKDNDSKSGSKGDYIYRENDDAGNEIISIMFEMKNEGDETATKKRNEDFLKELDRDRTEKKCEYAVLVSLLEADSEYYNSGIVDVSHKFQKTYVVRPQFFIPIITLLRNAAMNAAQYKAELALVKSQNIDITNFEEKMNMFKDGFARNYDLASRKFKDAIDGIDKTIKEL